MNAADHTRRRLLAALQGVRDSRIGPPMVARALAIVHTCMYDASAAHDRTAVGTRLGDTLRRPPRERTLANIVQAVSFAVYRAAVDLFPEDRVSVLDPLMAALGYDPADINTDLSTHAGVGNRACAAVLGHRHHDGANQQPLRYVDDQGVVVTPPFVGAHWSRVGPFTLPTSSTTMAADGAASSSTSRCSLR